MLTVEQVHNLVQQKIAVMSDRAWELYDREGVDFSEPSKDFCEFTRLHAMDELLQYRSDELTAQQLEEFYATALQIGGYEEMPFLPFDFSFLDTPVYRQATGGLQPHTHPVYEITGITEFVTDLINDLVKSEAVWQEQENTTDAVGALPKNSRLFGLTAFQILKKMLFSYQLPEFLSFTQSKPQIYEVGQQLTGTVNFSWDIINPQNVMNDPNSGSITASETGVFSPTGPFNLFGTTGKALSVVSPYTKNTVGLLSVFLNGKNSNGGDIPGAVLSYEWIARIYSINSLKSSLTAGEVGDGNSFLTGTRFNTLTVVGSGYKFFWLPNIIEQTGIKFIDPVNGNISIDMEPPVAMTVTNPQGLALPGRLYRTTNKLGSSLTAKIE